jgi:hypothetical protein
MHIGMYLHSCIYFLTHIKHTDDGLSDTWVINISAFKFPDPDPVCMHAYIHSYMHRSECLHVLVQDRPHAHMHQVRHARKAKKPYMCVGMFVSVDMCVCIFAEMTCTIHTHVLHAL